MTNDSAIILRLKKGILSYDNCGKKDKQPKTCQTCGLLLLLSSTSQCCTNCRRFNEKGSSDGSPRPKCRPFDTSIVSKSFTESTALDDFLKTGKFIDYLKAVNKYIPSYLMSAYVIKSSLDEAKYSVLGCLLYSELSRHLMALRIEHIQRWCRPILQRMMLHPKNMGIFNIPVDPFALEIPHYFETIKTPMDLGTVRSRLQRGLYDSVAGCIEDIKLTFNNAVTFNAPETTVHNLAKGMTAEFELELKALDEKCAKDMERKLTHSCTLCLGSCCPLCGEKCLKFEPQVLVCYGPCNQKIKKNSIYFVTPDASSVWCQKCYSSLPGSSVWSDDSVPYRTAGGACGSNNVGTTMALPTVIKKNVLKRRTDEEVAEPWVSCDSCGHWVHQICALYCDNFAEPAESMLMGSYQCPLCRLEMAASAAVHCEEKARRMSVSDATIKARSKSISATVGRRRSRSTDATLILKQTTPNLSSNLQLSTPTVATKCPTSSFMKTIVKRAGIYEQVLERSREQQQESSVIEAKTVSDGEVQLDESVHESEPIPVPCIFRSSTCESLSDSDTMTDHDGETVSGINRNIIPELTHNTSVNSVLSSIVSSTIATSASCDELSIALLSDHDFIDSTDCDVADQPISVSTSVDISAPLLSLSELSPSEASLSKIAVLTASVITRRESHDKTSSCMYKHDTTVPQVNKLSPLTTAFFPCNPTKSTADQAMSESFISQSHESNHQSTLRQWRASALQKTKLGNFIELMVRERLCEAGYGDISDTVNVRLTSNSVSRVDVPEAIALNMLNADGSFIPRELPFRQKCILLFQQIDGVDVCLFCLYVQEFDSNTPAPNNGVVYVAYLDSVDYFRPLEARTLVYQEVLVAYFKWVQARGFKQGHIWACPPQRGDNFIFWCHPPHQKTPSRERLNAWYSGILQRGMKIGVLEKVTNLWSDSFSSYIKRDKDETQQRQAARNSFVGTEAVQKKGNKKDSKCRKSLNASSRTAVESSSITNCEDSISAAVMLNGEQMPICPPIFDGEYWVSQCVQVHQQVQARNRGCDGKDVAVNTRRSRDCIKHLMAKHLAIPFNQPVDPIALCIPDYFRVISRPMDLGTVRDKLRNGAYENCLMMASDVRLTFDNAERFNPSGHPVHVAATSLRLEFEKGMVELVKDSIGVNISSGPDSTEEVDKWLQTLILVEPKEISTTVESVSPIARPRGKTAEMLSFRSRSDASLSTTSTPRHSAEEISVERGVSEQTLAEDCWDYLITNPPFNRSDSFCSTDGMDQSTAGDDNIPTPRCNYPSKFNIRHLQKRNRNDTSDSPTHFEQPQLGFRGAMTIMSEISKAVLRLKDDLFVFKFADPSAPTPLRHVNKKPREEIEEDKCGKEDGDFSDDDRQGNGHMLIDECCSPRELVKSAACTTESENQPIVSSVAGIGVTSVQAAASRRGRRKGSNRSACANRHAKLNETERDTIPDNCLAMLSDVLPDTSDPDPLINSPFVDSRHTFLEMCQFRHYQFDTLRRAKHSSLMLLYHLHNPFNPRLRPQCASCHNTIRDLRWRCESCPGFDLCDTCYGATTPAHEHLLSPFRVTFV